VSPTCFRLVRVSDASGDSAPSTPSYLLQVSGVNAAVTQSARHALANFVAMHAVGNDTATMRQSVAHSKTASGGRRTLPTISLSSASNAGPGGHQSAVALLPCRGVYRRYPAKSSVKFGPCAISSRPECCAELGHWGLTGSLRSPEGKICNATESSPQGHALT